MFGWICVNFPQKNKLFLILLALIVFQQDILIAQSDALLNQEVKQDKEIKAQDIVPNGSEHDLIDSQVSKKNLGSIPELVGNLEAKNGDMDINSMQDFFQEMMKIWADAKKREEERKLLFLSMLSSEHQELLKVAQAKYSNFLEHVDIRNGLADLCKKSRRGLENLKNHLASNQAEQVSALLLKIEKLQTAIALDYCEFLPKRMKGMSSKGIEDLSGAMDGLMKNLMPDGEHEGLSSNSDDKEGADPDLVFAIKDVADFCSSLREIMKSNIFESAKNESLELVDLKTKTENLVGILNDILSSILKNKQKDLILCYVAYLEPSFNETNDFLKSTQKVFEAEVKSYIANQSGNVFENEKDLLATDTKQKAYIFWFKEIKKCQRTMLVFSTLKNSSASCVDGTEKLFETVAYAYDIASCFYDFYKQDRDEEYALWENAHDKVKHNTPLLENEQRDILTENRERDVCKVLNWRNQVLIPKAVDWGISSGMALWFFFLNRPNVTGNLLLQPILGNMPLNMVDVKQTTILNFMAAPYAFRILLDPSSSNWQPPKLVNSLGKVAGAWTYYHIFYGKLFENDHSDVWDADYHHIKDSTYDLLIEVEKIISKSFTSVVRRNADPELVEKIEHWSLGVVKPEMIGYFAESMIPLLLFSQDELNGSTRISRASKAVFGTCDLDFLRSNANYVSEYEKFGEKKRGGVTLKEYYVEACISYYIASCVGKTLGAALARRVQGPCLNFATYAGGKFLDGLTKIHLIGKDTRELFTSLNEEFVEGFEENIMLFKLLFKEGFSSNSPFRNMLVYHLKKRGDIAVGKNSSEEKINGELLHFVLKQCEQHDLITYLDAATITKYYLIKQEFDDELIEKIISAIKKNMLAFVGAPAGGWVATTALGWFTRYNGPLQLIPGRVKNAVFGKKLPEK
ncbi:MAG: hypothetical protein WCS92_04390 [Candidatus Babeliales bacterium]|jgi:hypothetical protein